MLKSESRGKEVEKENSSDDYEDVARRWTGTDGMHAGHSMWHISASCNVNNKGQNNLFQTS